MKLDKTWWFAVALACAACADDGDEDTGAGPTGGSTSADDGGSTSADDGGSTSSDDGATTSGGSTSGGATETGHHDGSTGLHETEGHDTAGSETGPTVCEVLGEGCHDNETPEGIECHLTGHDGDEAACMKVFDMCAEICGL